MYPDYACLLVYLSYLSYFQLTKRPYWILKGIFHSLQLLPAMFCTINIITNQFMKLRELHFFSLKCFVGWRFVSISKYESLFSLKICQSENWNIQYSEMQADLYSGWRFVMSYDDIVVVLLWVMTLLYCHCMNTNAVENETWRMFQRLTWMYIHFKTCEFSVYHVEFVWLHVWNLPNSSKYINLFLICLIGFK